MAISLTGIAASAIATVVSIALSGCVHSRAPGIDAHSTTVTPPAPAARASSTAPSIATAQPTATATTALSTHSPPTAPNAQAGATPDTSANAAPAGAPTPAKQRPTRAPQARPVATPAAAATGAPSSPARLSKAEVATSPPQPTLDLATLESRLKDTHAIGVFTKLSLKNQVDELLSQMKAFHQGQSKSTLPQLRQNYEGLLLKVVSLLQSGDPQLASAVSSSRDAIWALLADPKKFAEISFRTQIQESSCAGGYRFYC